MIAKTPVGGALFGALLVAALVTAVVVVRARDPDLALEVTELTRDLSPAGEQARISFFVRESDDEAFVGIVGEEGEPVRTLAPRVALEANREVTYRWDGRADDGSLVAPESYYLRVELPNRGRDMIWPKRIKVFPAERPEEAGG